MSVGNMQREKRVPRYKNIVHLWEFLLELLADESFRPLIEWIREEDREFKLKNQDEVARMWGRLKRRPTMNYDKLSRALRHYYTQGIIKKVSWTRSKAARLLDSPANRVETTNCLLSSTEY